MDLRTERQLEVHQRLYDEALEIQRRAENRGRIRRFVAGMIAECRGMALNDTRAEAGLPEVPLTGMIPDQFTPDD